MTTVSFAGNEAYTYTYVRDAVLFRAVKPHKQDEISCLCVSKRDVPISKHIKTVKMSWCVFKKSAKCNKQFRCFVVVKHFN